MDFFRNCHFFNQLSDQYAENSKNTLFLDAYLYYNKKSIRGRRASGEGNSARNVQGNSQQPAFGNEMVPGNGPAAPGKPEKTDKTAQEGQITDKRGMDTWSTKYG